SHHIHIGSRTFAVGAVLTGLLGVLATFPLVARILFPRLTAQIRQLFGRIVQMPVAAHLHLERSEPAAGSEHGHLGFSLDEMTDAGGRLLRDIGLTDGFARLVILLGHGSDSLNNPHNSAYNCGACGGSAGGPNARAMAQVLNDPRVRQRLASGGLRVPDDTVFVGGNHNTCTDSVTFADLDRLPPSHAADFAYARQAIDETCARNAHERCRRFMSAPLTMTFAAAQEHVEERAEDLAQTRPELGHATNAMTIVGRREWTRGLFLDRRAFLTSYDPTQDDADSTILMRLLGAVFPVCAGINLEYYFSRVDNPGYGAGTKLPHNLAALLGVMDGAASDLRTGLPWQMVEIHEPMRSLFIIETTPERMQSIMDRNEMIGRLCRNGWILLSVIDPALHAISVYQNGRFRPYVPQSTVLPKAASS
ncbi:MAG TPA: putative inorganic carbon transporter subunit DabA, partial [Pirellulales bacterium]